MDGEGSGKVTMYWNISNRADQTVVPIADKHYNRQKVGSPQFVPPGRCLVLKMKDPYPPHGVIAFWVTSYPYAEYVKHSWAGALVCSAFRNEGSILSSLLIKQALSATRWRYPDLPELGMVTFVDASKVRKKRDPGRCFLRAGFKSVGKTKGGLHAFQLLPNEFPLASPPLGTQRISLF